MNDLLSNPWLVGIGTGIIAGVFTNFITRWLFSRKDNSEYNQKLLNANREVVHTIRGMIPENAVPKYKTIKSLIAATSRRCGVDIKDMYNPEKIAEELIKEVMDSIFLSAKTKNEYCEQLEVLTSEVGDSPLAVEQAPGSIVTYRQRTYQTMSYALSTTVALITGLVAIMGVLNTRTINENPLFNFLHSSDVIAIFIPATVAVSFALLLYGYSEIMSIQKRNKKLNMYYRSIFSRSKK